MALLFPDKRKAIIGEFFISDSRTRHYSLKACRKISNWKASFRISSEDTEAHFHDQFENLVKNSFFNTVSNNYILTKEKFHDRPIWN